MAQARRLVRYTFMFSLVLVFLAACDLINPPPEDTVPPTVTLKSSSTSVTAAGDITLTASAKDNVGVTKVEFYRNKEAKPFDTDEDGTDGWTAQQSFTAADNGEHTFTAKAYDKAGNSATSAKVTVEVAIDGEGNDAPVAQNQTLTTKVDTALEITLTATDPEGADLTYTVVDEPAHGTLSGTAPTLTYTPAPGYNGPDSFTFRANDGELDSNVATIAITVGEVKENKAPVAQDDSYAVETGGTLDVDAAGGILANDSDPDGDELTATLVDDVAHGTLTLNPDGSFTYTHNGDAASDTFTYKASDGDLESEIATVTIAIGTAEGGISDTDPGANDSYDSFGNTLLKVGPNGNVPNTAEAAVRAQETVLSDDGGEGLTVVMVGDQPVADGAPGTAATDQGGQVTMNADGSFSYMPPVGVTDIADTFTYKTSADAVNTVTVNLTELIWYVDAKADAGGSGSSWAPFNLLADTDDNQCSPDAPTNAEDAALTNETACTYDQTGNKGVGDPKPDYLGDIIFVFSNGTTPVDDGGIVLEDQETLWGQGVALVINGVTLARATPDAYPILTSTPAKVITSGFGVVLGGNSETDGAGTTVRGLKIMNTMSSAIYGSGAEGDGDNSGSVTIENMQLENIGTEPRDSLGTDPDQDAIKLDFAPASRDGDESAVIKNVTMTNLADNGIETKNAASVVIENVAISGLASGFEGIGLSTQFGGTYEVTGSSVSAVGVTGADGLLIFKNGEAAGALDLTVKLNGNDIDFGAGTANTRGFVIQNLEDGPDLNDSFDASGAVMLEGADNTVAAADEFSWLVVLTNDDGDASEATVSGSVGINGSIKTAAFAAKYSVPMAKDLERR